MYGTLVLLFVQYNIMKNATFVLPKKKVSLIAYSGSHKLTLP